MFRLVNPIANLLFTSRTWQLMAVLGLSVSATLVLIGAASAEPPNPCNFYGF
jgi:hypothetical protein